MINLDLRKFDSFTTKLRNKIYELYPFSKFTFSIDAKENVFKLQVRYFYKGVDNGVNADISLEELNNFAEDEDYIKCLVDEVSNRIRDYIREVDK